MSKIYVDEIAGIASPSTVAIPGHVIQTVDSKYTGESTTTSTSFGATSHSITITPSSTSSKILIHNDALVYNSAGTGQTKLALYRSIGGGSASIITASNGYGGVLNQANEGFGGVGISFLDSPATTSECVYTIYFKIITGGTGYYNFDSHTATLVAQEIAG